jgi:hypothetical protein
MVDKDIARLPKNNETEIVIRVDDFGGRRGVTIREFVKSERYTGFTKAGTRISAENFAKFKEAINAVDEKELAMPAETKPMPRAAPGSAPAGEAKKSYSKPAPKKEVKKEKFIEEDTGMEETEF